MYWKEIQISLQKEKYEDGLIRGGISAIQPFCDNEKQSNNHQKVIQNYKIIIEIKIKAIKDSFMIFLKPPAFSVTTFLPNRMLRKDLQVSYFFKYAFQYTINLTKKSNSSAILELINPL